MLKHQLSFWHMLLPALGLHALLLAYPLPSAERDLEAKLKPGKPVRVVKLPPSSKSLRSASVAKPASAPQQKQSLSVPAKKPIVVKKVTTLPSKVETPVPQPTPASTPTSSPTPQPSPRPSPTPSATPASTNELQMEGAMVGCVTSKTQDCFNVADEKNGRLFSSRIEAYFRGKGFALDKQEIEDEHGMSVYKLSKQGHPKDYLHVFWDKEGTTYLRSPRILNHQELALIARHPPS
jgi:outer membrane biosynthesis protein TonB